MRVAILAAVAALALAPVARAADAPHGRMVFQEQCGACHAAAPGDGDGGLGPDLAGLMGRKAGGDPGFSYSAALKKSAITWAPDTLDRFLADPQAAVPGTAMPINLADAKDRADVVSYLATVKK
jgi:cytochrome c2